MSEWGRGGRVSCCDGCKKRKVGCHDAKKCPEWAKEVEKRRKEKEAREAQRPVVRKSWEDRKLVGYERD